MNYAPTPESPDSWDTVVVGDTLRNEAGDEEPDDDGDGDVGGEEEEEEEESGGENFRAFVELLLVLDMPCKARVAISSFESPELRRDNEK